MIRELECVHVDLLSPGDTETVQAVFDAMSDEQRAQRFHVAMPRLPAYMLRILADVDQSRHVALVLKVAGRPAGIARYVRTSPEEAELAIAVGSDFVRRGYGSRLLAELMAHAARNGVTILRFEFLASNEAARRLALTHDATVLATGAKQTGILPTSLGGSREHTRPLAV